MLLGFTVEQHGLRGAVAAKLGLGFASDVFAVARDGESLVATRAFYGSKVHAELEFPAGKPRVAATPPDRVAARRSRRLATRRSDPLGRSLAGAAPRAPEAEKGDVDITTADFLLSIGRGIGEQENIAHVRGARRKHRRDALGLAAARRRGLDAERRARSASRARPSSRRSISRSASPAPSSTSRA